MKNVFIAWIVISGVVAFFSGMAILIYFDLDVKALSLAKRAFIGSIIAAAIFSLLCFWR